MRTPFDLTLYYVTDHRLPFARSIAVVEQAVAGGVTLVQLRQPDLDGRSFYEQAVAMKAVTDRLGVPLIINDRVDIALACGAAGVHVGQSDLPAAAARALLGPQAIVGLSITAADQLGAVDSALIDYIGIGPVFATATKGDAAPALGLAGTAAVAVASRVRTVAIGGIALSNAAAVLATGVEGLSVVSAISGDDDPAAAATRLRAAIGR